MNKRDVLKKTIAFVAALSFLTANQSQYIYIAAEEISPSNTKIENSTSATTTTSSESNNVVSDTVTTPKYTEPVVTTITETTDSITTTVTESTTTDVTTEPTNVYNYNFTFIGKSFENSDDAAIGFLKGIGISEEFIEITENGIQAKLPYMLTGMNGKMINSNSLYAKPEVNGNDIKFTEYMMFTFNYTGSNIEKNKKDQLYMMKRIGIDIDDSSVLRVLGNMQYGAMLPSYFGDDFESKFIQINNSNTNDTSRTFAVKVDLDKDIYTQFNVIEYCYIDGEIEKYIDLGAMIDHCLPYGTGISLNKYYYFADPDDKIIFNGTLDLVVYNGERYLEEKSVRHKLIPKKYKVKFDDKIYKVGDSTPEERECLWYRNNNGYDVYCENEYIKSISICDGDTVLYTKELETPYSTSGHIEFPKEQFEVVDGKEFTIKVDTIPHKVSVPKYYFDPATGEWEQDATIDFDVADDGTIVVPQRLQDENNIDKYLFITATENTLPQSVPNLGEIVKQISADDPKIKYSPSMMLCYYGLKQSSGFDFESNVSNERTLKYAENVFIRKLSSYFSFMSLSKDSIIEYVFMDEIFSDCIWNAEMTSFFDGAEKHWEEEISPIDPPTFINITSILDDSGNNYLDSNQYIYLDAHAPRFELAPQNEPNANGEVWTNSDFIIDVTVDDKFSVSADDFGEELHSKLDGITSKTGKVIISDDEGNTHTFTKNPDGTFECKVSAPANKGDTVSEEKPTLNYSISCINVVDNSDKTETLSFSVSTEDELFVKEFTVSVEDGVGNPSTDKKSITTRIEKIAPELVTVEDAGRVKTEEIKKEENKEVPVNCIVDYDVGGGYLVISGQFDDKNSGLKQIEFVKTNMMTLDESKELLSGEQIKDGKFEYKFSSEMPGGERAWIDIIVTDYAGNEATYSYTAEPEKLLDNKFGSGCNVIFDKNTPTIDLAIASEPDYIKEDQNWYKAFPEINVSLEDKNISSGINKICWRVNKQGINYIKCESEKIIISPDEYKDRIAKDGKIEIQAYCTDVAGHKSEIKKIVFYVDDIAPTVSDTFKVKNKNVQLRKFGTFYNDSFEIDVDISDSKKHSSDLKKVIMKPQNAKEDVQEFLVEKNKETDTDSDSITATATFGFECDENGNKSEWAVGNILAFDNAGNQSEEKNIYSEKGSDVVVIEKSAPVIKVGNLDIVHTNRYGYKFYGHVYKDEYGNDWFPGDAVITFNVSDDDSGIWTTNITRKIYEGVSNITDGMKPDITETMIGEDSIGVNYADLDEITKSEEYIVSTRTVTPKDGAFVYTIEVFDNATNKNNKINGEKEQITIYKDDTAPEIIKFIIDGEEEEAKTLDIGMPFKFKYFKNSEKELTVVAKDENASAGIDWIRVYLTNPDGSEYKTFFGNPDKYEENGEIYYKYTVTIPEGFNGDISAEARDKVTNMSKNIKYSNASYVSEDGERHKLTSSVDIKLPSTTYTDRNGTALYNQDIDAELVVSDKNSGIKEVAIKATDYGDAEKKATVDIDGNISDNDKIWNETVTDESNRNLVSDLSGTIKMSSNENGNTISLHMADNSGNTSSVEKQFSIDKTAPEIYVSFGNDKSDETYSDIYNADRRATVKIKERNFDPAKVTITPAYTNTEWVLVEGTENTDSAVYQSVITFVEDGKHSFTVDCTDMADNKAAQYQSPEFIIDKTAPDLEVSYDNTSFENENHFSDKRTATIKITETNFDPSRIKVTGTRNGKTEDFPAISQWSSDGDVHTATLLFDADGYYTIEVSGRDKAGNNAEKKFSEKFHIDTVKPDIQIGGVEDEKAYNGEVAPSITITDTNLDTDSIQVSVSGVKRGEGVEFKNTVEKENGKVKYTFESIPKTKENDDIYTVTVTAKDKSGNDITSEKKFSVNRYGSTFELAEATAALNNNYTTTPQDVVIREINVNSHKKDFTPILTLVKDGRGMTLVEGEHYALVENDDPNDWADYEYIIYAKNFEDDALYELSMYTEDEAGNKNNTDTPTAENPTQSNALLTFGVDKTNPNVNFLNAESDGSYRENNMTFKVMVEDNIMVRNVEVYVNSVKLDPENYTFDEESQICTFNVPSAKEPQRIEVIPYDMAGNIPESDDTTLENVLISPSFARVLVHKTWFKVAVAALGVAAAGFAGFMIKKRKNKKYR